MKTLLNPGLKPVKSWILYFFMFFYIIASVLMIGLVFLQSWSEKQIIDAVQIKRLGMGSYELTLDDKKAVPLNYKQKEQIISFEDCTGLTQKQQEIVDERYGIALEHFPTSLYPSLWMGMDDFEEMEFSEVIEELKWFVFYAGGIVGCLIVNVLFIILLMVVLFRAWKSVQMLRVIDPETGGKILTPGKYVGYLFIPLYNIFFVFKSFGGLWKKGMSFAQKTEISYRGPGPIVCWMAAAVFAWNTAMFKVDFFYMTPMWIIDMLSYILTPVLFCIMVVKMNRMVRDFSAASIDDGKDESSI